MLGRSRTSYFQTKTRKSQKTQALLRLRQYKPQNLQAFQLIRLPLARADQPRVCCEAATH
jgi:hypothetical protein